MRAHKSPAALSEITARRSRSAAQSYGRIDEIRALAIKLFSRQGYEGATMRQIAKALKTKAGSLYYWYPSKQDLLFDVLKTIIDELKAGLEEIAAKYLDPKRKLEEAIRYHVLFHARRKDEAFISHSELRSLSPYHYKVIIAKRDEYDRLFQKILFEGTSDGTFELSESELKVVSYGILRMCAGAAIWFSEKGKFGPSEIADIYCRLVFNGILPRSKKSRTGPGLPASDGPSSRP